MKYMRAVMVMGLLIINNVHAVITRSQSCVASSEEVPVHLTEQYVELQDELKALAYIINHSEHFMQKDMQEIIDFCTDENIDKEQLLQVLKSFINDVFATCAVENKQTNAYRMYKDLKHITDQINVCTDNNYGDARMVPQENDVPTRGYSTDSSWLQTFITAKYTRYGALGLCASAVLMYFLLNQRAAA
jgi:hypothetical protein